MIDRNHKNKNVKLVPVCNVMSKNYIDRWKSKTSNIQIHREYVKYIMSLSIAKIEKHLKIWFKIVVWYMQM